MNRTRKLALGVGAAAALLAGGVAVAAPALAQDDPPPSPAVECPYECPFEGDGLMHKYQHGPHGLQDQARQEDQAGRQDQAGQQDHMRDRDRDGTCRLPDDEDSQS